MKEKLLIKDFLYDDFEQSYKIYNEKLNIIQFCMII